MTSLPVRTTGGAAGTSMRRALSRQMASTMPVSAERVSGAGVDAGVERGDAAGHGVDDRRRGGRRSTSAGVQRTEYDALAPRRAAAAAPALAQQRAPSRRGRRARPPRSRPCPASARSGRRRRRPRPAPAATSQPSTSPTGASTASAALSPPGSGDVACARSTAPPARPAVGEQLARPRRRRRRTARAAGPGDHPTGLPRHLEPHDAGLDRRSSRPRRSAPAAGASTTSGTPSKRCHAACKRLDVGLRVGEHLVALRRPAAPGPMRGAPPPRGAAAPGVVRHCGRPASSAASSSAVAAPSASASTQRSNCQSGTVDDAVMRAFGRRAAGAGGPPLVVSIGSFVSAPSGAISRRTPAALPEEAHEPWRVVLATAERCHRGPRSPRRRPARGGRGASVPDARTRPVNPGVGRSGRRARGHDRDR